MVKEGVVPWHFFHTRLLFGTQIQLLSFDLSSLFSLFFLSITHTHTHTHTLQYRQLSFGHVYQS